MYSFSAMLYFLSQLISQVQSTCYPNFVFFEYEQSFSYLSGIPLTFRPDVTSSVSNSFTFTAWIRFDAIVEDKSGNVITPVKISCLNAGVEQFIKKVCQNKY